jgi:membrane-associated phospholipid phosphatase
MAVVYWLVGTLIFDSPLNFKQCLILTSVLGFVIVGAYQLFFWTEYNNTKFEKKVFHIPLDDKIPFISNFIWIYSLSYYAIIGLVIITVPSIEKGMEYIFGGLVLLTVQCIIFYFIPSTVPESWRKYHIESKSARFLKLVQRFDVGRNCMPSMHMSVAMYVSLLLFPILSYYSFIFVLIIGISCLFVKQHVLLDLLPGIALGWLVHTIVL